MNKRVAMIFNGIRIEFLIIFIPTLICILIWGNEIDYNYVTKLVTMYGNKGLLLMCFPVVLLLFALIYLTRKIKLTNNLSIVMDVCLIIGFVGVFFVNLEICKCINIAQGWDVSCVVGTAYELNNGIPIGDTSYYSLYPNNVPITFVLYKLIALADSIKEFPFVKDFMWVIANCFFVSVTGYLTCISVKKITQNFASTIITFILYVACVGITPWKTVPYTDMFAILFPMLCINLYIFCYYCTNKLSHYILWFLIYVAGFLGSLIKPTVFIIPIAITMCELVCCFASLSQRWKELLTKIALMMVAMILYGGCKNYIYEDVGYVQNKEIQFTALHFLMMGLNEESTGSYASGDVAISGNVSLLEDRTQKQIEVSMERLKEKGFIGYIDFLLRKMVMTFNDGTFGWGREGAYTPNVYPIYTDASYVAFVRELFMPNYMYSGQFNTYSQTVWLLIIFCIPGVCLMEKEKREVCMPILVSMLGIIFYLMLFEARARYLICFLPVIIMTAALGMKQYYEMLKMVVGYLCNKIKNNLPSPP